MELKNIPNLHEQIKNAFAEDIGDGDHSTLASIPAEQEGRAQLLVKEGGILAGVELAKIIFELYDPSLQFEEKIVDGTSVTPGEIAFIVSGSERSILSCERLVLNYMQRLSGIATKTAYYVSLTEGTHTQILDTRKTTPGLRGLEKWAVTVGGGGNHRMGLYDMIMLKDNHIDFCGGIEKAVSQTREYLKSIGKDLKIEVETRNLGEVQQAIDCKVDRIMLDNFSISETKEALKVINGQIETESSGGITDKTLRDYAECGVDFISVGALTHQISSLDLSLKAIS
ncbi:MAG: carboxylating nicotinate-nucleotide diphosphorylase [Schleiferiaceae bacterium]